MLLYLNSIKMCVYGLGNLCSGSQLLGQTMMLVIVVEVVVLVVIVIVVVVVLVVVE